MRLARFAAPIVAALALAACATIAPAPKGNEAAAYFAQDFTCEAATAKTVEMASIAAAPARYAGHCVNVSGFAKNDRLYRDGGQATEPAKYPHLVLLWRDKALQHRLQLGPSFVKLTGRVRPCPRRRTMAAEAPGIDAGWGCPVSATALTISKAEIVPTSMD